MRTPGQARVSRERFYHDRSSKKLLPQDRPFIAWDGEGVNIWGAGNPQAYVLFGNSSDGCITSTSGLSTWDCLDFIIEAGIRHPHAFHVGFAFGYDSNMIVQSLSPTTLFRLHKQGFVRLKRGPLTYVVTYRKSKYFQVSRTENGRKTTVRIFDIFTFFMCSFIKAYEDMFGAVGDNVEQGKERRKDFSIDEMPLITTYWEEEIQQVRRVAEELRNRAYAAGLPITEWHGPGALSSLSLKQHGIKSHMKVNSDDIRMASRYAYAAGRFEPYKVGRIQGPIYGIDLNSAYPFALTSVPSLSEGQWEHHDSWGTHNEIPAFGLYRMALRRGGLLEQRPSPLYLRDKHHELYFPWHTNGWWWGREAANAVRHGARILEAWIYVGWKTLPFEYLNDMYDQRAQWKAEGNSAQMMLKLAMNAKYGKMAQRVGWDPRTNRLPAWHQLEWAGYATSHCRANIFQLLEKIPFEQLIAVETDGIYTTADPRTLGISGSSSALGGWSVDIYDEAMYVQSGLAWLRQGECRSGCTHSKDDIRQKRCAWTQKRRGLDYDSFSLEQCRDYLRLLHAHSDWPAYEGLTTRFTSMGQALATRDPKARHCVWVTAKRSISTGKQGKRIHVPRMCAACDRGLSAYDMAHDLVISPAFIKSGPHSYPHEIPWEEQNEGTPWWREREEEEELYA